MMEHLANKSDVARFIQMQKLQEDAAKLGMYGSALVASHEAINARMNRKAEQLLELIEKGKYKEVAALMEKECWE
jgi:hypothetical protein